MNKPIALAIRDLRNEITMSINKSQLPASVLEPIIGSLYQQIAQASEAETAQAEQQYAEETAKEAEKEKLE